MDVEITPDFCLKLKTFSFWTTFMQKSAGKLVWPKFRPKLQPNIAQVNLEFLWLVKVSKEGQNISCYDFPADCCMKVWMFTSNKCPFLFTRYEFWATYQILTQQDSKELSPRSLDKMLLKLCKSQFSKCLKYSIV